MAVWIEIASPSLGYKYGVGFQTFFWGTFLKLNINWKESRRKLAYN